MASLEGFRNIGRVIQEKRTDMTISLINMVHPYTPEEPPVTRESLNQIKEQVELTRVTEPEAHVLVDFSIKHEHNV